MSARVLQFPNPSYSPAEPELSLADRIGQIKQALTAKELAGLLHQGTKTIYKHAKAGRIPSFRVGTSVLFDPVITAKWLRQKYV